MIMNNRALEDSDNYVLDVKNTAIANIPLLLCMYLYTVFIEAFATIAMNATTLESTLILAMVIGYITLRVLGSMVNNIVLEFKPRHLIHCTCDREFDERVLKTAINALNNDAEYDRLMNSLKDVEEQDDHN